MRKRTLFWAAGDAPGPAFEPAMRAGFRDFMRGRRGFRHMHGGGDVRSGRGNMKYEILSVLADGPRHGYDVMLEIERRRGGLRPSPGSIYPALQMLEDGDFVTVEEVSGKRTFSITDTGRALLAEHAEVRGDASERRDDEALHGLLTDGFKSMRGLMSAAKEVARSGNAVALKRVVDVLDKARRDVYAILADEL
jgi:DNA-binding PadR family transcriptional regulator